MDEQGWERLREEIIREQRNQLDAECNSLGSRIRHAIEQSNVIAV